LKYNDLAIPSSVPQAPESAFKESSVEPIATMFTVPSGYNFQDPACKGVDFICWPTVGVSSVEYYESKDKGIPGWDKVLLVTTLKRGSLYVLPLRSDGKAAAGHFSRYFRSENRFRDTAVSPDGRTIYIAIDASGLVEGIAGPTVKMEHPGAILAFTYAGEGTPETTEIQRTISESVNTSNGTNAAVPSDGVPPQFTAAQAAKGKIAYNSTCAVCHGTTMTNGAYGTPLAGEYFKANWSNKTARAFYDRAQKTMPPAHPGSLPADTYANIVAYIFEVNGFKAGNAPLTPGSEALDKMLLK
jgi:cytochrome c5